MKEQQINHRDLRDARIMAGVTLAAAGEAIGIDESQMCRVESGTRKLSLDRAERLTAYLAAALRRRAEQAKALAETLSKAA